MVQINRSRRLWFSRKPPLHFLFRRPLNIRLLIGKIVLQQCQSDHLNTPRIGTPGVTYQLLPRSGESLPTTWPILLQNEDWKNSCTHERRSSLELWFF